MARYDKCIGRLNKAAGRTLSDAELEKLYGKIHRAALALKRGEQAPGATKQQVVQFGGTMQTRIEQIATAVADDMKAEAARVKRQAALQAVKLGARIGDFQRLIDEGIKPMHAPAQMVTRDFSGRVNIASLEQRVFGVKAELERRLLTTWDAMGNDWLGLFQDRGKQLELVRELRGEDSGNPIARRGAKAFHDTAEYGRQWFNSAGGHVGVLDDWGFPQHHSQEKVAAAGQQAWVDEMLPVFKRTRDQGVHYQDENGAPLSDAELTELLTRSWQTIATNGLNKLDPGQRRGSGGRANRHAEERQLHFPDAESVIAYWEKYGERTVAEVLHSHIDTMARDIAFIEWGGPNPNTTFSTLRDMALKTAATADAPNVPQYEGQAVALDRLWNYVSGNTTPTMRPALSNGADALAHLNTAGKLGGAALASFFGDKPVMEVVMHLNDVPMIQRWQSEMRLLNPAHVDDRRLLQQQGLMLDSVRSGLQRFYEGLGKSTTTGTWANAVMRVTGMTAINDIRKAAAGLNLMASIGAHLKAADGSPIPHASLDASNVRMLRNWGIERAEWDTWQLARLETLAGVDRVLTPEAIADIPDDALKAAHVIGQADGPAEAETARRNAIVKLLGAVNTESEFAIVTPGWRERSAFYGGAQRGTFWGEFSRSVLQFKSFPWAFLQRGMDLVANAETLGGKTTIGAYIILSTTLMGALLLETREMLAGKDPRSVMDDRDWWKFWAASFVQGGALGIYGDLLYSGGQSRYGTGVLEMMAGPTVGPLLEMGLTAPLKAANDAMNNKETHLAATYVRNLKGFVPGSNIWYFKTVLDHVLWQQMMEQVSPGYLSAMRQRTAKEYGQDWWWKPGEMTPDRPPDLDAIFRR